MANTTMQAGNDARDAAGHNRGRTSRTLSTQAGKLDGLPGWETAMVAELGAAKFHGGWIRIHDFLGQFRCVSREHVFAA